MSGESSPLIGGHAAASHRATLEGARAQLAELLRGRRWMREPTRELDAWELEDLAIASTEQGAALAEPWLLAILHFPRSRERYFVPLRAAAATADEPFTFDEASYDPGLIAALLQAMERGAQLATEQGHTIELRAYPRAADASPASAAAGDGAAAQLLRAQPFHEGMSSNCLSEIWRHGQRSVCKLYKRLGAALGDELGAMERLTGTPLVPRLRGAMIYHGQRGPEQLALLSSMAEGELLHVPLSKHLKALCAAAAEAPARAAALIPADLGQLRPLLRAVGAHLRRFHGELNRAPGGDAAAAASAATAPAAPAFDLPSFLEVHKDRWQRLHAQVHEDAELPEALARPLRERVALLTAEILEPARHHRMPAIRASVPHGDLHLSHIMVSEDTHAGGVCFLDASPRALDPDAPLFRTQAVQQDLASLCRSLQYFCFDEVTDAVRAVLGCGQEDAARVVLERPHELPEPCHALLRVLSEWSRGVFALIEQGYQDRDDSPAAGELTSPWTRLFYTCRLFHELEYNYSHRRAFFKYCDFYYLLQMNVGSPTPPQGPYAYP
jgi:1-epi-valienol-7-phosphate kinase